MMQWRLLCLIILAAMLAACDGGDGGGNAVGTGGETLVFVSAHDTNTLDPQKMSWLHDIRMAGCLWEPLVKMSVPDLTLEPGVARKWEISEDGLTYTFHLRKDARWSNGDPVTAGDFLYAWRRALLPDFAADYAQSFFCIRGAQRFFEARAAQLEAYRSGGSDQSAAELWSEARDVLFAQMVGITAPDPQTLVVELAEPTPYFLELCAFATFYPNHAASLEAAMTVDPDTGMLTIPTGFWLEPGRLITNGPYQLESYEFKEKMVVSQNPHFWDREAMNNTRIVQRIIGNAQSALQAYTAGQVHWVPDIPSAEGFAADLVASGRSDVHTTPWAGTYFYSFNCLETLADGRPNPLADPRVRAALSLAIDRSTIVGQVTRMHQPTATSFIPPGMIPGYEPPVEPSRVHDVARAKQLLAEAGYPEGRGLDGLEILYNTNGGHEDIAQAIRHMWREQLGVVVAMQPVDGKTFSQQFKNQQYTIARASWIGDYRDPTAFLAKYRTESGNNDAKWSNAEFDRLLAEAARELDAEKRMAALRKAEALLIAEQPIAPIFHYITLDLFDPSRVRGILPNAWNFRRLEQVEIVEAAGR